MGVDGIWKRGNHEFDIPLFRLRHVPMGAEIVRVLARFHKEILPNQFRQV